MMRGWINSAMARRKSPIITPKTTRRQRQSARVSRSKAKRVWWKDLARKLIYASLFAVLGYGSLNAWWAWKNGDVSRIVQQASERWNATLVMAGFGLEQVYITGRDDTPYAQVTKALNVRRSMPLPRLPIDQMRERLEALPEVEGASIRREYPNMLWVHLRENAPYALWQHQGKQQLVDAEGNVMHEQSLQAEHAKLILFVGEDIPMQLAGLSHMLDSAPSLREQVAVVQRIAGRRSDVILKNGVRIMLPEVSPDMAWQKLAQLQDEQAILARAVSVIDMRIEGRLFVTPSTSQVEGSNRKVANSRQRGV